MNKKFSWRSFISFGLTYTIFILLISGVMLYMSPPGRYAHWVNWEIWGFSKESWQAIHTVFSYTFVILSVFHLFTINWKVFLSYFKKKSTAGFNKKWEFISSTALVLIFFFGIIYAVQPFQAVMDFGEYLTESWEKAEERAPVPHAELLTLNELAHQLDMPSSDEFVKKLENHNLIFENTHTQTLQEIAKNNHTTPQEIYEQITKLEVNQRQGSGIGRKTLEDFALEVEKSVEEILTILKNNNITAEKGQTLRNIGDNNNIPPRDIYDLFKKE